MKIVSCLSRLHSQDEDARGMVDLVFAEFYCVLDRTSSESIFRERVAELITPDLTPVGGEASAV